jgi:hypothetical protein
MRLFKVASSLRFGSIAIVVLGIFISIFISSTPSQAVGEKYMTISFGRVMYAQSESCQVIGETIFDIAESLKTRGIRATGVVVPARTNESTRQCYNGNIHPSWDDLARLRDDYGWTFVSNGQNRVDITQLSPAEQQAESCGSQQAFLDHGHSRSWGMFGPGSNRMTTEIADNVVSKCFAFIRQYWGTGLNTKESATTSPFYVKTDDTSGGQCKSSPCSGNAGIANLYMQPEDVIARINSTGSDQWYSFSTYKLMTGSKLEGNRRWDCTSDSAGQHWTTEVESYCLNDFLAVMDGISPEIQIVDQVTVARAWGRDLYPEQAEQCPAGQVGTPPNCVPETICPDGTSGTYPDCIPDPVVIDPDEWAYWGYLWSNGILQSNGSYFWTQTTTRLQPSVDRFSRGAALNGISIAFNSKNYPYTTAPKPHPALKDPRSAGIDAAKAYLSAVIEDDGLCGGQVAQTKNLSDAEYAQTLFEFAGVPSTIKQSGSSYKVTISSADFAQIQSWPFASKARTPGAAECSIY